MKSRKKVISFVLTLMLVLGLVPMGLGGGVDEVYAAPNPATVGNVNVAGTSGVAIVATDVAITITNNSITTAGIAEGADLAAWITNLPSGLTAVAKAYVASGATSVAITIAGTPTVILSAPMAITIPSASLTIATEITVPANSNAKFTITTFDSTLTSVAGIYQIQTKEELTSFATLVNQGAVTVGKSFKITGTEINLTGIAWTPIGTSANRFKGNFDGNNKTISNLTITTSAVNYIGLFGYTEEASIGALNLSNVSISAISRSYIGGLVGYALYTTISGVTVSGIVEGYESVGGLIGYKERNSITDCNANVDVVGYHGYVGGLVGYNIKSEIEDSYATGAVTAAAAWCVGGLVGKDNGNDSYHITSSYATGAVNGLEEVGGLIGYATGSIILNCSSSGIINGNIWVGGLIGDTDCTDITESYATGDVTGDGYKVGGLVGYSFEGYITSSYATGDVKAGKDSSGNSYAGGLFGYNHDGRITSSYAIGYVTATGVNVGGLVGYNDAYDSNGCFWDWETSGMDTDDSGATSCTSISMQAEATFINKGWDFTTTWAMGTGAYIYPVFKDAPLQDPADDPIEEVPAATHHHHSAVAIPEAVKNLLRFNIGDIDSFVTLGSSGEELKPMDVAPILFENRTVLPIRFVVEPLGGTITWNGAEKKVTITRGTITIELWIGNNVARVNGVDKVIDPDNALVKPIIVNPGRTMLPLRFISEALGCTVDWDAVNKEIIVSNW